MENRSNARKTMDTLLEKLREEAERGLVSLDKVAALSEAISALAPLVTTNW